MWVTHSHMPGSVPGTCEWLTPMYLVVYQVHVSDSLTCTWSLVHVSESLTCMAHSCVWHDFHSLVHVSESHHTHEWAMSYIWRSHSRMSHVDEPCRTYEWVMSHIHEWAMSYIWMSHSVQIWWTHIHLVRDSYTQNVWLRVWYMPCRHVVHIGYIVRDSYTYSSWLIYTERVVESLVHAMSSCRTSEWVTSHIWTHAHWHVEYGSEPETYEWVMSHS